MKIYFNNKKIVKKHWYGDETEDNFIEVELLGTTDHETDDEYWKTYLIKLPDGTMKEVVKSQIFSLEEE